MKLASLRDGSRDGHLAVVSRDGASAHFATGIATRLQHLLDDWNFVSPQLEDLYATLNGGKARHAFPFDPRQCLAPLPRAYGLVRPGDAGGLVHCSSDRFLGATDTVHAGVGGEAWLAVVTGDLAADADAGQALDAVRLVMLGAGWPPADADPLRRLAFAPLAVTVDELAGGWRGGRARLTLRVGEGAGSRNADARSPHFGELLSMLAHGRRVGAGTVVAGPLGVPLAAPAGAATRIEAVDDHGLDLFGAIAAEPPPPADATVDLGR